MITYLNAGGAGRDYSQLHVSEAEINLVDMVIEAVPATVSVRLTCEQANHLAAALLDFTAACTDNPVPPPVMILGNSIAS